MEKYLYSHFTNKDIQISNMFRKDVQYKHPIRKWKWKSKCDNSTTTHLLDGYTEQN